jgi:hypothetical protein
MSLIAAYAMCGAATFLWICYRKDEEELPDLNVREQFVTLGIFMLFWPIALLSRLLGVLSND